MSHHIQLIMGSTRPNRISDKIAEWLVEEAKAFPSLEVEVIDLRDINLPFTDEPMPPSYGMPYTQEHTKAWSEKVKPAEGFIFLTPEYNAGYPAVLKNAIDALKSEWAEKPAVVISYGFSGGASAQQQLVAVLNRVGLKTLESTGSLFLTRDGYTETGALKNPAEIFAEHAEGVRAAFAELEKSFQA